RPACGAAALLAALLAPSIVSAQTFEQPPSFTAAKLPGLKVREANYTVRDPVRSDGLMRVYALDTPYGPVGVQGDRMLRIRLNELAALRQLETISGSDRFADALVNAGLSPIKYTGRLITNPVGTVGDTLGGIGNFFGRIGSGIANVG